MIAFIISALAVTSIILYKLYSYYDLEEDKKESIEKANEKLDELKIVEEAEGINFKSAKRKVKINELKTKTQEKENESNN